MGNGKKIKVTSKRRKSDLKQDPSEEEKENNGILRMFTHLSEDVFNRGECGAPIREPAGVRVR